MSRPLVSVLIPAFNAEHCLGDALQSIKSSGVEDYEIIVVDDGSNDRTAEIARKHLNFSKDTLISLRKNGGLQLALNVGLAYCNGLYIARLDADDLCANRRVYFQVKHMEENKHVAYCGCDKIKEGDPREKSHLYPKGTVSCNGSLPIYCCYAHPGTTIHRERAGSELYYDPKFPLAEDYDLWARLFRKNIFGDNIDTCGLIYRVHPKSLTFGKPRLASMIDVSIRQSILAHTLFSDSTVVSMLLAMAMTPAHSFVRTNHHMLSACLELLDRARPLPQFISSWSITKSFASDLLEKGLASDHKQLSVKSATIDILEMFHASVAKIAA